MLFDTETRNCLDWKSPAGLWNINPALPNPPTELHGLAPGPQGFEQPGMVTAALGSPFQCFTDHLMKKFFQYPT